MKKYIIATLFVCAVLSSLYAQEKCPGESLTILKYEEVPASWTDCFGKIIFGSNSDHRVGYKYEGEFKNGKMHGQGTFTWAGEWQGQQYVGELKEGYSHGQGTITYKNGDVYNGEWKEGKRHGQGTRTQRNGNESVGEWKGGKLWNGVLIRQDPLYQGYRIQNYNLRETVTDGNISSSESVPTKIFQEKIKSANVDKNKCYTLFMHAHSKLRADGDFSLRRWIDKIKILKPSIEVQTQNYLIANYSYSLLDYRAAFGKHHHIWVACENLTESVEVANPFD